MTYHCSKCKLAVIVLGETKIKACKCEAPVVAVMTAKAKGHGRIFKN